MKNNKSILGWIGIGIALASTVGIFFIPGFRFGFLLLLIANVALMVWAGCRSARKDVLTVCRLLIGALFIFSSFTKGVDPLGTKYKMLEYFAAYHIQWLNELAMVMAVLMILVEFLVGICLITNVAPKPAVVTATLFMLIFSTMTLFDALYDMVPDCGCFGSAVKMTNWQTFYKNLVIDAVLLPLILNLRSLPCRLNAKEQTLLVLAYALTFTGFELYNYRHLPVIDFMDWKVGRQMNEQPEEEPQVYLTFKNKDTGATEEYLSPNYPWNDSVWMSQWEFVDQRVVGGQSYLGFSALDEDGDDVTEMILTTPNLLMFTSHDMSKITDKEWWKIEELTATAVTHGCYVVWVTATGQEEVHQLQAAHPFMDEVYYGDELEIKTIVRYNPGVIWLDEGLVVDKWSAVDFAKASQAVSHTD